jgi:hypothetical protein
MSTTHLRLVPQPIEEEEIPEPIAESYSPGQRTRRGILIAFALFLWNSRGYVFMIILAALWVYLVRTFFQSQIRKD